VRCVVVGTSGSGKSTFARALAAALQAPCVELDSLYWGPDWTPRPEPAFMQAVQDATAGGCWVVDGNYSKTRPIFWPRATHVIWLNFSRRVTFWRVLARTLRRARTRELLWGHNRELLSRAFFSRDSILLWALSTYPKNQIKLSQWRASPEYGQAQWHELRTPRQAAAFLRAVQSEAKSRPS
jgi:adenylate kinase family enzyme